MGLDWVTERDLGLYIVCKPLVVGEVQLVAQRGLDRWSTRKSYVYLVLSMSPCKVA